MPNTAGVRVRRAYDFREAGLLRGQRLDSTFTGLGTEPMTCPPTPSAAATG